MEFGAGDFKEITCKVVRKSMGGEKTMGQVVLITLKDTYR